MITKMTKYSFILLSGEMDDFLTRLQELGMMDISRSTANKDALSKEMAELCKSYGAAASRLERFEKDNPDVKALLEGSFTPEELLKKTLEDFVLREELNQQMTALSREKSSAQAWGEFSGSDLERIRELGFTPRFYSVAAKKFKAEWRELYPLQVISERDGKIYFTVLQDNSDQYSFPLQESSFPERAASLVEREIVDTQNRIREIESELAGLAEHRDEMRAEASRLFNELDLYHAKNASEKEGDGTISILRGFAPTSEEAKVTAFLDESEAYYLKERATAEDNPPIKLKNNWFARQFEVLTGMYGAPVYDEFDPTPVLAPFFLLFFSMCMGDAGYGILLILIGIILGKTKGGLAAMSSLVTILGAGTFLIGLILGTLFGMPLSDASWYPQVLKSCIISGEIAGFDAQMVLAVAIGVFHICVALIIKALGFTKRFGFRNTVSTWGWVLLIIGSIVIVGITFLGVIDKEISKYLIIAIGIIAALGIYIFNTPGRNPLINIGAGLWDTYNMASGLLGDALSYIRLYALGLAGGMLGGAFNDLAMMIFNIDVPVVNIIGMAIILALGHALNLAMSCLGAFVHPLRLTFVEYFKNSGYEGKGISYNPLKK